jgi:hypothetical protein
MIISPTQFDEAYSKLPYPIREYIAEDGLSDITQQIGTQYGLHVDTVGALYREVTNMLLGLMSPEQFVGELKSVGIPAASIGPITQELNQKIFIPLHEKMQKASETPEEPDEEEVPPAEPSPQDDELLRAAAQTIDLSGFVTATSATVPTPVIPPQTYATPLAPTPVPIPAPTPPAPIAPPVPVMAPAPTQQYVAPAAPPIPVPEPVAPPAPVAIPVPATVSTPPIYSYPAVTVPNRPIFDSSAPMKEIPKARTMAEDMQSAQSQGAQAVPVAASVPAPISTPAPMPLASPEAMFVPMPPPIPAAPAAVLQPVAIPQPQPTAPGAQTAPSQNKEALYNVMKSYGVDPYRESPE